MTLYAAVALATTGAVLALWSGDVLRSTDLRTVDARFSIRGEHAAPDVVVVGIDARTNAGRRAVPVPAHVSRARDRSPAPRRREGDRLRRRVHRAAAATTRPTTRSSARSTARRGSSLSTTEVGAGGATNIFGGDEVLREIGARAGSGNVPNDPGGVLRRFAYDDLGLRGLPVVAAELAHGRPVPRDRFAQDGTAWIDFPGPPRTVRTVSFGDVLEGRVPAATLRDKVVVVGATAPVLKDVFPTSTGSEDLMAGPEVQAAAIQTVLDDFPLRGAPGWLDGLLIAGLGLAGAFGDRPAAARCAARSSASWPRRCSSSPRSSRSARG